MTVETTDTGRTHYPGCWRDRGHHGCAIARVGELEAFIRKLLDSGGWHASALEFDWHEGPDGIELEAEARELLGGAG